MDYNRRNSPEYNDIDISEVQSNHNSLMTNETSDISQDLIKSTKILEQHFKNKYKVLKQAYESRLKQLSQTVASSIQNIAHDEVIAGLKQDLISSTFIPQHITEVFEKYLENDREIYLNQVIRRLQENELELNKSKDIINKQNKKLSLSQQATSPPQQHLLSLESQNLIEVSIEPLKEKLNRLNDEFNRLNQQTEEDLDKSLAKIHALENSEVILKNELNETRRLLESKMRENDSLLSDKDFKNKEIMLLQQQLMNESNKDLYVQETNEKHLKEKTDLENNLYSELKSVKDENFRCLNEIYELQSKVKFYESENQRFESILEKKTQDEVCRFQLSPL